MSASQQRIRNDTDAVDAYKSDLLLRRRAVIEFIASWTEPQVEEPWRRLMDAGGASAVAGWLRT